MAILDRTTTPRRAAPPSPRDRYCALRDAALAELDAFEGLGREAVRPWQLARLHEQVAHARRNSPFYRHHLAGLPADTGGEDPALLPFTTKDDLRRGYPLELLAVPPSDVARYGESTGTTGSPTSSAITYQDWVRGNVSTERSLAHRFGPGDLVFVAIPYELSFAAYDLDRALETVGAAVVGTGILSAVCPVERTARMIATLRPAGIVCSPTRALRLHDLLREAGHDPAALGVRTVLYVGETCSPAKLAKIARLWQADLVPAYGTTETNSLALSCERGRAHLTEDRHLFEVLDPATGAPLRPGATGELVLSTLVAQAMPLLRYRTGDLVSRDPDPCPCGSVRATVRHHGRVGDRLLVAGRSLDRLDLEEAVLSVPGTGLYYAAGVEEERLRLRVECPDRPARQVCAEVAERVHVRLGVTPEVTEVDRATVGRAMDAMLKPGNLTLADLDAAR
ncbi:phenylacetate--CoA ligase family protein [Streptomyces spiramenti]|uniref:Phenylacetate--CoA ligase family protein n=1 Tax=Streptomyces spiramenti TaxID=2720606 RepID=A0ABX1AMD5_9ACTN|nr:AMP-binding protein [Streptomyces spiramenti]NJP67420.1 phenylacetate--CoA ligase family protein [Streptomyces spiramenti]